MSSTAIFLTALTAAGLVLLLWVIGRAVTAAGNRVSSADSRSRHYLAGRLDGVQITAIIDYDDELLVSLATQDAPLAGVFRITASTCSLTRVRRWHDESTPLRAYLSHDGAIMLADPALGGNAPCEPPTPDIYHARDEATPPRPLAYQGQMTCAAKRPVAVLPARPPAMQAAAGELRRFPGRPSGRPGSGPSAGPLPSGGIRIRGPAAPGRRHRAPGRQVPLPTAVRGGGPAGSGAMLPQSGPNRQQSARRPTRPVLPQRATQRPSSPPARPVPAKRSPGRRPAAPPKAMTGPELGVQRPDQGRRPGQMAAGDPFGRLAESQGVRGGWRCPRCARPAARRRRRSCPRTASLSRGACSLSFRAKRR